MVKNVDNDNEIEDANTIGNSDHKKEHNPLSQQGSRENKKYFIDESGFLVNMDLLDNEPRKSRDERMGTVSLPKRVKKKKSTELFVKPKPNIDTSNRKERKKKKKKKKTGLSIRRTKTVTWTDVVKCPICDVERIYGELFTHVEIYHPEENAKIVLDQFNRLHGVGKYRYEQPENDRINQSVNCHP